MVRLSAGRASELLQRLEGVRALVVGDLMLDRYLSGVVDRISPEAPVPVVRVESQSSSVGGAGNVAANLAALGVRCSVVGVVGEDDAGQELLGALDSLGVEKESVVSHERRPTSVKTRVLARRQQIVRYDIEDERDLDEPFQDQVTERVLAMLDVVDVVVLEDYNKGVLAPTVTGRILDECQRSGLPTVVDPKRRGFFRYRGATVFKPNAKELADALGEFLHPEDAGWMEATRRRLACETLLLTLGERGMAVRGAGGVSASIPAIARDVYDVSGAGDTVTAVMAAAAGAGLDLVEAALLANHAAAVEVGKAGVASVDPAEILESVRAHDARSQPSISQGEQRE